jgi:peptide-methionine (R)-S-oxide reductase
MSPIITHPSRRLLLASAAGAGLVAVLARGAAAEADPFASSPFRKLTPDDWRKRLPPASFDVLRQEGTEAPFTSPLNDEHRRGTFLCLGCELPLFRSEWKFNSGTGWPSFFRSMEANVRKKADFALVMERTEYHCARCLGHQGHLFNDGPQPTGLRYCNDGVALKFVAG